MKKIYAIFVSFPDGTSNVSKECFTKLEDAKKLLAERTDEVENDGWIGFYSLGSGNSTYRIMELTLNEGDK